MSDFEPEYVSAAPTRADIALKAIQHARVVRQLWFFLTAVIGFLAIINFSRRLLVILRGRQLPPTPSVSPEKDSANEDYRPGATGNASLRRVPAAVASAFRIVMFRRTISLGLGGDISVTETTFIVVYIVAHLIWLFVDSESFCQFVENIMLTSNKREARSMNPIFFEDRAAHLATCQLPLIVALAGKNNILSCKIVTFTFIGSASSYASICRLSISPHWSRSRKGEHFAFRMTR